MSVYTLTYNGVTRTLTEWGISTATLTLSGSGKDVMNLVQQVADIRAANTWPSKALVTVERDGQRIFVGRIMPGTWVQQQSHARRFTIVGPWNELERRAYAQMMAAGVGFAEAYGRVGLMWGDGELISTGAQIRGALNWAIAHAAPVAVGNIHPGIQVPPEMTADRSVADVISRMLQLTPDQVAFWDYTVDPPTLNVQPAFSVPEVVVACSQFAGDLQVTEDFTADVAGIIFTIKTQLLNEDDDVPANYFTSLDQRGYPPEIAIGDEDVLSFSYDQADYEGLLGLEDTTADHAAYLARAIKALHWSGAGTLKGSDCPRMVSLGQRISLSGGQTAWTMMSAPLQGISYDLVAGTTKITWGQRLSVLSLLNVAVGTRRRANFTAEAREEQQTGQSPQQTYGFDGKDGKKKPTGPTGLVTKTIRAVEVAGDGTTATTITVMVKPATP